ncbi:MAG TPA: urease accessory protein UreD [Actinocrinis sp.]|nr:urease accessory protein UreD [Actinocrinis sp.]
MRASARIVARRQPDGTTRLTTLAGEAPLLLRRTTRRDGGSGFGLGTGLGGMPGPADLLTGHGGEDTVSVPAQVCLAGGSAGPLGGDALRCSVDLGPGARLEVHGVAASIALPGPNGRESSLEIHARVGEGGALLWSPQPLIAARGARHRTFAKVELAADARLVWRDELILGRDGEEPGSVSTRLRVIRAGRVLLDREVAMGPRHPGSLGPAGSGGHRALGTVLIVDPAWAHEPPAHSAFAAIAAQDDPGVAVATMRLSGPAVLISAAAPDGAALRRVLDRAL